MSKPESEEKWAYKVLMLGNLAVGKTSLVIRFVEGKFRSDFGPTIGANFLLKRLSFEPNIEVTLSLWDISGHFVHKPQALNKAFYQGANGCFLVCDLGRPETLADLASWKAKVEQYSPDIPMLLLANKNDIASRISEADLQVTAAELDVLHCCSTSAKTGAGVVDSFHTLAHDLLRRSTVA
ncbi:MAG: Rab family GTPase [Candidatus Hodarchaeales archaeon]